MLLGVCVYNTSRIFSKCLTTNSGNTRIFLMDEQKNRSGIKDKFGIVFAVVILIGFFLLIGTVITGVA